jgi:hypothetical protein
MLLEKRPDEYQVNGSSDSKFFINRMVTPRHIHFKKKRKEKRKTSLLDYFVQGEYHYDVCQQPNNN